SPSSRLFPYTTLFRSELGDGAGEAVGDKQRLGAGMPGFDMQEVDPLAVDLGGELRVVVELCLGGAPVVLRAPVPGEVLQVAQRRSEEHTSELQSRGHL